MKIFYLFVIEPPCRGRGAKTTGWEVNSLG